MIRVCIYETCVCIYGMCVQIHMCVIYTHGHIDVSRYTDKYIHRHVDARISNPFYINSHAWQNKRRKQFLTTNVWYDSAQKAHDATGVAPAFRENDGVSELKRLSVSTWRPNLVPQYGRSTARGLPQRAAGQGTVKADSARTLSTAKSLAEFYKDFFVLGPSQHMGNLRMSLATKCN